MKSANPITGMEGYYHSLQSERLNFRPLTLDDRDSWKTFYVDNPQIAYLNIDLNRSLEALAEAWITAQMQRYAAKAFGQLAMISKATGELIGTWGFKLSEFDHQLAPVLLGAIKPAHWRQGFGTESGICFFNYLFQALPYDKVYATVDVQNIISPKCLHRLGFTLMEADLLMDDRLTHVYACSKAQWLGRSPATTSDTFHTQPNSPIYSQAT